MSCGGAGVWIRPILAHFNVLSAEVILPLGPVLNTKALQTDSKDQYPDEFHFYVQLSVLSMNAVLTWDLKLVVTVPAGPKHPIYLAGASWLKKHSLTIDHFE